MSHSRRIHIGGIAVLIVLFLVVFPIGCAHKAPVKETAKQPSVVDTTKLYKDELQRFSARLSAKIDAGFKPEFMERGPGPVMLAFKADGWSSFYDRLNFALREQLGNTDIQFVKPDWEFSEDIFAGTACPEELLLPEYKVTVSVRHYESDREFWAIADAKRLGSKRAVKKFPAKSSIGGASYPNALANWKEKQKRPDLVEGSPEKPYQSYKRAGSFLARLIECKMSLASDLWKKSDPNRSAVNFRSLSYRMLGLRPSPGVSDARAGKIAKAVYQELKNAGITVVAEELDMDALIQEVDKYDKFKEFYFEGKEAGEVQIVPGQAFVVGDVTLDEVDNQRLEISIRTVLGSRIVDGLPSQGIVIPALGGTCYAKVALGGDLSLRVVPADASVWLDDQKLKLTQSGTVIIKDLPFGGHTFRVVAGPAYHPIVKEFEFIREGVRNWILELPRIKMKGSRTETSAKGKMSKKTIPVKSDSHLDQVPVYSTSAEYLKVTGKSANNQDEYSACTAARVIAQAKLLEALDGVEIIRSVTVKEGRTQSDVIRKIVQGVLRGAEDCGKQYNEKKGSCMWCLRIKLGGSMGVIEVLKPVFEQENF